MPPSDTWPMIRSGSRPFSTTSAADELLGDLGDAGGFADDLAGGALDGGGALADGADAGADGLGERPDRAERLLGRPGEVLDLAGDDAEALAVLAGASGLDGGVEGEQIGLVGDLLDQLGHVGDLDHALGERG